MARLIKADGTVSIVTPANGVEFNVDEICRYVDGHLDAVRLTSRLHIYVDDEGLLKHKTLNQVATALLHTHRPGMTHVRIVGDVLIADISETGDE